MAVNTEIKPRKQNTVLGSTIAVVLLTLALLLGLFAVPAMRTDAASLKTVTSCKGLTVKQYGNNGWWTYSGNTRVSYTGLAQNEYGWWRTVNGKVDFHATGIVRNDYGWYRVVNGKVRFDQTGVYKNEYGWWYCLYGKVDFGYTGMKSNEHGSWRIENGKVNFNFNGLAPDETGTWYYFTGGKVDYSREGLVKNENGTYYVKGGKIDFSFTGDYHGYKIVESKVVEAPSIPIDIEDATPTTTTTSSTSTTSGTTTSTTKSTTSTTGSQNLKNLYDNSIITDRNGNVVVEDTGIVVDISKWNGDINFTTLKNSGVKGVMMRACYATTKDAKFDRNSSECERLGIDYGVYQFANFHYGSTKDAAVTRAKTQADYLISLLKGKKVTGYVCLDLELESGYKLVMNKSELTDVVNYYCSIIESAGYKPMVYCSVSWLQNNLDASRIKAPFWVAYYNDTGSYNYPKTSYGQYMNSVDGKITMWQYTDKGKGSKYGSESEYIDLNRLYHSFTGATK